MSSKKSTRAQFTGAKSAGHGAGDNPLFYESFRIPFHRIRAEHVVPGVTAALEEARAEAEAIAANPAPPTWENVIAPFDALGERLGRRTGPVHHLLAVAESPELRTAWGEVLPEVSRFSTWLYLHEGLWARISAYAETPEAKALEGLRARHLSRTLQDFRRAGAGLDAEGRKRLETMDVALSKLSQEFAENVLDSTAAYTLHVTDGERLRGVPEDAMERFRERARAEGKDGWILTLDHPSFEAVMKHSPDRALREELHRDYYSRATEEGHDNRPLIPRILALRTEKAKLLGYPDFPDYRLEEAMAGTGRTAREFVAGIVEKTRPFWERDLNQLREHARTLGVEPLEPWDVAYVAEKLRKHRYDLDDEEIRPYFPLDSVLTGMFEIVRRLFGLAVVEKQVEEIWHPSVRYFELYEEGGDGATGAAGGGAVGGASAAPGTLLGGFYIDLFPRPEKRDGGWMNDLGYGGPRPDGSFAPHLGVICANFPPPGKDRPALLTHRDVQTLFHEFGHLLHHLTSRVPIAQRGGVSVAWDWVELPSQLMENWTWERASLDLFARHWKTGEPLPEELFRRMHEARRFLGGWAQMRQLGFGTFDLALHTEYSPERDGDPVAWVTRVLERFSAGPNFARSHPLPFFQHLFAGGYAASYYSYMWSEVLEADLFTAFERAGIFDRALGRKYLETILQTGDSEDPAVLYRTFMGRDPDPEALIRRNLGEAA